MAGRARAAVPKPAASRLGRFLASVVRCGRSAGTRPRRPPGASSAIRGLVRSVLRGLACTAPSGAVAAGRLEGRPSVRGSDRGALRADGRASPSDGAREPASAIGRFLPYVGLAVSALAAREGVRRGDAEASPCRALGAGLEPVRKAGLALDLEAVLAGVRARRVSLLAFDGLRPPAFFCVTIPTL